VRGLGSQSAAKQRGDDRPLSRLRSSLGTTAAAALALAVAAVTTIPARSAIAGMPVSLAACAAMIASRPKWRCRRC